MLKVMHIVTQFSRYFVTWVMTRAVTSVAVVSMFSTNSFSLFSCRLAPLATTSTPQPQTLMTSPSFRLRRSTELCGVVVLLMTLRTDPEAATKLTTWRSSMTQDWTCLTILFFGVVPAHRPAPTPVGVQSTADRQWSRQPDVGRRLMSSVFSSWITTTTTMTMIIMTTWLFTRFHAISL